MSFRRIDLIGVVIGLGLLALLILPALARTKRNGSAAVCQNNLRQIGVGVWVYAEEQGGFVFTNEFGALPNQGQWTASPRSAQVLEPGDALAYWGVAYLNYVGGVREVFRCPNANIVDEWRETGTRYASEWWRYSSYGFNGRAVGGGFSVENRLTDIPYPENTILVEDSAEQKFEGVSDSLGLFPGTSEILAQWVTGLGPAVYNNYDFTWEWYRHDRRCNVLWVSGAVSALPFTGLNVGIDYRYYIGDVALPTIGE